MASTLLKTIKLFKIAVGKLKLPFSLWDVERIGIMIYKAMSTESRNYHTAEHIFTFADIDKPLLHIAALFHDIVYLTIDGRVTPEIGETLNNYVQIIEGEGSDVTLRKDVCEVEPLMHYVIKLFNVEPGEKLQPFNGMNEFLSALVFFHECKNFMRLEDIFQILCCIELTIPFRGIDGAGKTPPERLANRLEELNTTHHLGLSEASIVTILQESVVFANTDVLNFSSNEVSEFLVNTWKLLPETNPPLRISGFYTVKNYRVALHKICGFMNMLDPETIFLFYQNKPSKMDFHYLGFRSERNITTAREYLSVKLFTIGVLEAIVEMSGGDTPISLIMGDSLDPPSIKKFESMLPDLKAGDHASVKEAVFATLDQGRTQEVSFDLNRSPLSCFIYLYLGSEKLFEMLVPMYEFFDDKLSPHEFLALLPNGLILPIVRACMAMTFTRRKILLEYYNSRKGSQ